MSADLIPISRGELKPVAPTVSCFTPTTAAVRRALNSLVENDTSLQMEKIKVIFIVSETQLPHPHPSHMLTLLGQWSRSRRELPWETNSDRPSWVMPWTRQPLPLINAHKPKPVDFRWVGGADALAGEVHHRTAARSEHLLPFWKGSINRNLWLRPVSLSHNFHLFVACFKLQNKVPLDWQC